MSGVIVNDPLPLNRGSNDNFLCLRWYVVDGAAALDVLAVVKI